MKEFENWLDEKSYSQAEERIAEQTWRAALEMVLGASQCSGDSADIFWDEIGKRYIPVGCDVRDVIREELDGVEK